MIFYCYIVTDLYDEGKKYVNSKFLVCSSNLELLKDEIMLHRQTFEFGKIPYFCKAYIVTEHELDIDRAIFIYDYINDIEDTNYEYKFQNDKYLLCNTCHGSDIKNGKCMTCSDDQELQIER
jgi:hypothetical protein